MFQKIILGFFLFFGIGTFIYVHAENEKLNSEIFMFSVGEIVWNDSSTGELGEKTEIGGMENIKKFTGNLIPKLMVWLMIVASFLIVIGGIVIAISQGSSDMITKGKNMITYSIVAIIIALLSAVIIKIIWNLLQ